MTHACLGNHFFSPVMFLLAYVVAQRFALKQDFKRLGPTMLLGVWLSGGFFMTVATMASGSEFIGGAGLWRLVVIVISVIPMVPDVLAAYDGSVFALLAITVGGLLILGIRTSWTLWTSAGAPSNTAFKRSASQHDQSTAALVIVIALRTGLTLLKRASRSKRYSALSWRRNLPSCFCAGRKMREKLRKTTTRCACGSHLHTKKLGKQSAPLGKASVASYPSSARAGCC